MPWLALLLGVVLLLARPGVARAHGVLRRSAPAAGARLATAPRELRLTFNERVELAVARLELRGAGDRLVALSPPRAGAAPGVLVADVVGPLVAGGYVVVWQVAGADGHPVRGRFRFSIAPGASGLGVAERPPSSTGTPTGAPTGAPTGGAAAAGITTSPAARNAAVEPTEEAGSDRFDAQAPLYALVRWLGYLAAMTLVGAVAFARLVVPRALARAAVGGDAPDAALRAEAIERARRLGLAAAVALVVVGALRLIAQAVALDGAAALDVARLAPLVARTRWGQGWTLQLGAALVAAAGLALAGRQRTAGWTLAGVAILALALGAALSGHAAAVPRLGALAVLADAAHVLGAGGWLGTLLVLAAAGLPAVGRAAPAGRGAATLALVRAFSPVALACAALAATTGAAAALWHLGAPARLVTSGYGRTLLLKLAALAVVAALGAYHWRRTLPALAHGAGADAPVALRRTALLELAAATVVLALTAVLVATPTPVDGTP